VDEARRVRPVQPVPAGAADGVNHERQGVPGTGADERLGCVIAIHDDGDFDLMPDIFAATHVSSGPDEMRMIRLDGISLVTSVAAGDSLVGKLANREDRDGLRFEMMNGESISFTVKGSKRKSPITLVVVNEVGDVLLSSDESSPFFDAGAVKQSKSSLKVTFTADELACVDVFVGKPDSTKTAKYTLASKRITSSSPAVKLEIPFDDPANPLSIPFTAVLGSKLAGKVSVSRRWRESWGRARSRPRRARPSSSRRRSCRCPGQVTTSC